MGRGLVSSEEAAEIRKTRVREVWDSYDSIKIYNGANDDDAGWFDTFADFARASQVVWFSQRSTNIHPSASNLQGERRDFAIDIYRFGIEFFAPFGQAAYENNPLEADFWPLYWTQFLVSNMHFSMKIAQTDQVISIPGDHAPIGRGPSGGFLDASSGASTLPPSNGTLHVSNTWKFPDPLMLPAKAQLQVIGTISDNAREFLRSAGVGCPTYKEVLPCPTENNPSPAVVRMLNEYRIKVVLSGFRYVQLRGARSAR